MIKFSVKKPWTVFVAIAAVFILGYGGFRNMTPELLPNIDFPYVIVVTTYPGATPEKVEREVTKPIEKAVASLENLENVTSTSNANVSMVQLEFSQDANLETTTVDLLQTMDQVKGGFDSLVGSPLIIKANMSMMPVLFAAVDKEGMDTEELSEFVEDTLSTKLEGIEGVAQMSVSGLVEKQANAILRQEKIDALNEKVAEAVRGEFKEKEQELLDAKQEIEENIDEVDDGNAKVKSGLQELANKAGSGAAEISSKQAELTQGKIALQLQLAAATNEFVAAALKAQLDKLDEGSKALSEAQANLESAVINGQFELDKGAAALAAAEIRLDSALEQIDDGIKQIAEAKDDAVESADIHGVITMDLVSAILSAQHFSMPAGYITENGEDWVVRVENEISSLDELENIALMDMGLDSLETIKLSDVADVFISDNLDNLYAKINGKDGVTIAFTKQSVFATAQVTDNIAERFESLEQQFEGLEFTTLMNQGDYIYMVVGTIFDDLLWGALFAILILFLFLRDIRPTFITLCSIPISVVFAIVLMYFAGVTINIISLSGLAIAVGMLVDNSIVVIENIFRLRAKGFSAVKAAVTGASQVAGAIAASTLTTVCVFLPIVFVQGLTRKLFSDLALTLAFALIASLIIALTLVPAMASRLFTKMQPKKTTRAMNGLLWLYDKILVFSLKYKFVVIIISIAALGASAYAATRDGLEYMPESDTQQIQMSVTVPEDAGFETLKARANEAMDEAFKIEGVETIGGIAGDNTIESLLGFDELSGANDDSAARTATFYILTKEGYSGKAIAKEIEKKMKNIDAEIDVENAQSMDMSALASDGISINLIGDDMDALFEAAEIAESALSGISEISNIENGIEDAVPELRLAVDREKAAKKELTVAQVFSEVSAALSKEKTAVSVDFADGSYDVILKGGEDERLTREFIENYSFRVTKKDGSFETVKLSDIATETTALAPSSITRVDQQRQLAITLTAKSDASLTIVQDKAAAALAAAKLPAGVTYEFAGGAETILDAVGDLALMLVLGILLVYLIMVAQFQSLKSPFIVMFTIPLAFTGGFLALIVTGQRLSVISLVGFVMLVGIIVNNAIVLVDYINQLRRDGMERIAALREAGATRMRPILMTALTTVLGLSVMALGVGSGSEMMQPLAIVCIGGLLYATLMTMFVVPVIYDIFNKKALNVIAEDELVADMEA